VIPLSCRVPGRASRPSRSRVDDGGGLQYVFCKIDLVLRVFPSSRIYRRKGGVRRWARWPHHLVARAKGRLCHPMVWMAPGSPRLCFGLRLVLGKIGTSAFVSSNSENISCVTFLKHKNSRKQGTDTMASH
jgi:hypothetical protein